MRSWRGSSSSDTRRRSRRSQARRGLPPAPRRATPDRAPRAPRDRLRPGRLPRARRALDGRAGPGEGRISPPRSGRTSTRARRSNSASGSRATWTDDARRLAEDRDRQARDRRRRARRRATCRSSSRSSASRSPRSGSPPSVTYDRTSTRRPAGSTRRYLLGGARTGRMSCRDPTFNRSRPASSARSSSRVPATGSSTVDYSQVELRVVALLAKDSDHARLLPPRRGSAPAHRGGPSRDRPGRRLEGSTATREGVQTSA